MSSGSINKHEAEDRSSSWKKSQGATGLGASSEESREETAFKRKEGAFGVDDPQTKEYNDLGVPAGYKPDHGKPTLGDKVAGTLSKIEGKIRGDDAKLRSDQPKKSNEEAEKEENKDEVGLEVYDTNTNANAIQNMRDAMMTDEEPKKQPKMSFELPPSPRTRKQDSMGNKNSSDSSGNSNSSGSGSGSGSHDSTSYPLHYKHEPHPKAPQKTGDPAIDNDSSLPPPVNMHTLPHMGKKVMSAGKDGMEDTIEGGLDLMGQRKGRELRTWVRVTLTIGALAYRAFVAIVFCEWGNLR
ncbi:hypothetical protein YB2330_001006 [Saitoella coloradoensis]